MLGRVTHMDPLHYLPARRHSLSPHRSDGMQEVYAEILRVLILLVMGV